MTAYVEVNEVRVFATHKGADWWTAYLSRQHQSRFTYIEVSIAGALVRVACDDHDHAKQLLNTMVAQGMPKAALKVGPPRRGRAK